ncbi:MAG: exodeoxyribonuclease V subunit gamma, partial [Duodenibacillus sp.]|nr:exodeoxyribonuclease V subunit gamma [Duodenibacillus sp.]
YLGTLARENEDAAFHGLRPARGTEYAGWDAVTGKPELLGKLLRIADDIFSLYDKASSSRGLTLPQWKAWALEAGDLLFGFRKPGKGWQSFCSALALVTRDPNLSRRARAQEGDEAQDAPELKVDLGTFALALAKGLEENSSPGRAGGAVTLTGMHSLRHIPYKAIAVIGLNEDSGFPGNPSYEEFDLMHAPGVPARASDIDPREDNRNLFLDLLLAAEESFCVLYDKGRGVKGGLNPSIVVTDLIELAVSRTADPGAARMRLVRSLPASRFAQENFLKAGGGPGQERGHDFASHSAELADAVNAALKTNFSQEPEPFAAPGEAMPAPAASEILPLRSLARFWQYPGDWTNRRLRLALPGAEEEEDPLPVVPEDALRRTLLRQSLLEALEGGGEPGAGRDLDPLLGAPELRAAVLAEERELVEALIAARDAFAEEN